ncbi:MAG: hypothetical protein HQK58_07530 [Deltaproteobacteria bacterium]|nr:hypothetical protein [Deltaproteobacteria bacterium]
MKLRLLLVNLILLAIVVWLGVNAYRQLTQRPTTTSTQARTGEKTLPGVDAVGQASSLGLKGKDQYDNVVSKTLFRAERKAERENAIPAPVSPQGPALIGRKISDPGVVLYGVTVIGRYREALIEYTPLPEAPSTAPGTQMGKFPTVVQGQMPRTPQKSQPVRARVRAGETINDFRVKEIKVDRLVLDLGEQEYVVPLMDPLNPKKRSGGRTEMPVSSQPPGGYQPSPPGAPQPPSTGGPQSQPPGMPMQPPGAIAPNLPMGQSASQPQPQGAIIEHKRR